MSWDINRVILVGRLSNDVELKYTPGGTAVARFGIAVGGRLRSDGSESVSFFNVVVWGKPAENCSNYLSKGKKIALDGRLEQRSWTAQDGTKRSVVEIIAERVEFLGAPSGKVSGGENVISPENTKGQEAGIEDVFYDNTDFNPNPVEPESHDDLQDNGNINF